MMILDRIVAQKRERLTQAKGQVPLSEIRLKAADQAPALPFQDSLRRTSDSLALIAEVKKASPSRGVIRAEFDAEEIARTYRDHGASAISVLTEEDFFQGSLENLVRVRRCVELPLLRKDFIFDPYQVYEARAHGADAILLIAAILSDGQVEDLSGLAAEMGMASLLEVHTGPELDRMLGLEARFIGINNRDLSTLQVDIRHTLNLLPDMPEDCTVVTESGLESRADVETFLNTRVTAMLVGSGLMKSENIGKKIDELLGRRGS